MKCSDCDSPATGMFHFRNQGASANEFKHIPRCDLHSLKDHPQAASCTCMEDWRVLIDRDWRPAAFLLLDKRLSEHPHLHATTNPAGDYEIRCSLCGEVETYLGTGDKEVDALTFALHVTGKHAHKSKDMFQ